MKIVYDNIIFSLQKAGGISIYWAELIKRLNEKSGVVFYESENQNIFRKMLEIKIEVESTLSLKILRYLPFLKKLQSKSIFHSSYYRTSYQRNIVNITTVHDFTYEYFRGGLAKFIHNWQKGFAIKRSDGIICVSENTKKDLIKFFPKIDESKIKVIYNGVGKEFKKLNNPNNNLVDDFEILRDKKYIIYIGDRSKYKNFDVAINVIEKMLDYYMVIIGGNIFDTNERKLIMQIENRVIHFRAISSDRLNILYNNAFCLLYPSSYEGFGIPIIEAMKAGCPIVSTNISSIPEVAGSAGLLVDEIKIDSFINEIKRLRNDSFRLELIEKGFKQSNKFCWNKCFDETYQFYEEVWNKKFGVSI